MDPNAALVEIRALSALLEGIAGASPAEIADRADDVERLCELQRGLDGWLSRGGFLPDSWKR